MAHLRKFLIGLSVIALRFALWESTLQKRRYQIGNTLGWGSYSFLKYAISCLPNSLNGLTYSVKQWMIKL